MSSDDTKFKTFVFNAQDDDFIEIIEEYIDETEYEELIRKVAMAGFDDAAIFLLEEVCLLDLGEFNRVGDIWGVFVWDETPQGHKYWVEVAKALNVY